MIYCFDKFQLDLDKHELREDSQPVSVEPQVIEVLRVLVENRDRTVAKDELFEKVWPGKVVSDSALSSRIKSARKVIGDTGSQQALIKTVHGVGFRFVGDVQSVEKPEPCTVAQLDHRPSILVLPFESPPSVDKVLYPQALAHDVITGLSRLRWLKVIARASAFQLATATHSLARIRQLTGVSFVLSGFLEVIQGKVSAHFELIDARDESLLWADKISASKGDIHGVRSQIVNRVVSALELQISAREAQLASIKSPENLDAWESYHLAISHLFRFNSKDNAAAAELFRQAVALEPGFARAHAGVSAAEFQNAFYFYEGVDRSASINAARRSAERSVELDNLDPMANFVMGRTYWLQGDPESSVSWLERAITLNPNYAQGYYAHGLACLMSNRESQVHEDAAQAVSLSPLDPFMYGFFGIRALSFAAGGDLGNATKWALAAATQPGATVVLDMTAAAFYELGGDRKKALFWARKAKTRSPGMDGQHFFAALPFSDGPLKSQLANAFSRLDAVT